MNLFKILLLLSILAMFVGCLTDDRDNPFDVGGENFDSSAWAAEIARLDSLEEVSSSSSEELLSSSEAILSSSNILSSSSEVSLYIFDDSLNADFEFGTYPDSLTASLNNQVVLTFDMPTHLFWFKAKNGEFYDASGYSALDFDCSTNDTMALRVRVELATTPPDGHTEDGNPFWNDPTAGGYIDTLITSDQCNAARVRLPLTEMIENSGTPGLAHFRSFNGISGPANFILDNIRFIDAVSSSSSEELLSSSEAILSSNNIMSSSSEVALYIYDDSLNADFAFGGHPTAQAASLNNQVVLTFDTADYIFWFKAKIGEYYDASGYSALDFDCSTNDTMALRVRVELATTPPDGHTEDGNPYWNDPTAGGYIDTLITSDQCNAARVRLPLTEMIDNSGTPGLAHFRSFNVISGPANFTLDNIRFIDTPSL